MRRVLSAVVVGTVIGASALLGGSAAVADDEPPTPPTLADALATAAADGATDAAQLAAAGGLPIEGPGSLTVEASGEIAATVQFAGAPSAATLDAVRALATIDDVYTFTASAAITVDPARLTEISAIEGVRDVTPALAPIVGGTAPSAFPKLASAPDAADCRAFPSDAVEALRADIAREAFGVDGTGVTVGIISDSFAAAIDPVTTPEQDVEQGVLPGPGNPCGYTTPVTVLDDADPGRGDDEGRAMAQLVHGIAPGATLLFHSSTRQSQGMAEGIIRLAAAGADIIVDDIGFFDETYFQQGGISAAITAVQDNGVAYYTSAGNQNQIGAEGTRSEGKPISSWQTSSYRGIECPDYVVAPETFETFDCLDFSATGEPDADDTIAFGSKVTPVVLLNWAEPIFGVGSRFAPQLYVDGEVVADIGPTYSPDLPIAFAAPEDETVAVEGEAQLVVVRDTTTAPTGAPAVWVTFWAGDEQVDWRENDTSAGEVRVGLRSLGHPADGSGIGVAAAPWSTPTVPEDYTSPGGSYLYFEQVRFDGVPAPAYPTPVKAPGPQIASVDGNRTSFFGSETEVDGELQYFFYGTSAAAPNTAAVHALATEYAPAVPAADVSAALFATAREMQNDYAQYLTDEEFFGAGLLDANALLEQLPPPGAGNLSATALSASSIAVEWDAAAGAVGYRIEVLAGDAPVRDAEVGADTTATTFTGLAADTAFTVRVTTLGAVVPGGVSKVEVRTPVPPVPSTAPTTPTAAELGSTPAPGLVATPASVVAGGSVTITGLPARDYVYGWVFSDPQPLGWSWTGAAGSATFTVPETMPAGAHRLALRDADGHLLGWVALEVTASAPVPAAPAAATLPRTGLEADLGPVSAVGALALLIGAGLVAAPARRRRSAIR